MIKCESSFCLLSNQIEKGNSKYLVSSSGVTKTDTKTEVNNHFVVVQGPQSMLLIEGGLKTFWGLNMLNHEQGDFCMVLSRFFMIFLSSTEY